MKKRKSKGTIESFLQELVGLRGWSLVSYEGGKAHLRRQHSTKYFGNVVYQLFIYADCEGDKAATNFTGCKLTGPFISCHTGICQEDTVLGSWRTVTGMIAGVTLVYEKAYADFLRRQAVAEYKALKRGF